MFIVDKSTADTMSPRYTTFSLAPNADDAPFNPTPDDGIRNPFTSQHHATAFDTRVEDAMAHWRVPGLAISIVNRHELSSRGYGVQTLGGEDVTPKTVFDIASMSKSFTAAGMALLVQNEIEREKDGEEGKNKVDWGSKVNDLIPEFVFQDERYTREVTVEDILSHRSGIPGYVRYVL